MDDKALISKAKTGDQKALYQLYKKYANIVYRYCLTFSAIDEATAKDLVQETFIRAYNNLQSLRDEKKFKIWLLTIARNRTLSYLSQQNTNDKKINALSYEQEGSFSPSYAEQLETKRQLSIVRKVIEEFPDNSMKESAKLFYLDGLSTTEIAEKLNIPRSTVTTRLDRFRAKIRKKLLRLIIADNNQRTPK